MLKLFFRHKWGPALLILLLAALVFFYNLGDISLWDPDEPRGAVIAHEMLQRGDWIHLSYNGHPVTDNPALVKPPLYYWSIALFSALQGHVDEFSARLPSALAGITTAILVFFLGARIFGTKTGFLGGLIFISNHMLFEQARSAEIDMTLTFLITAALFLFYHCYHEHYRPGWLYPAYAALGLAVLAKGPVGVIVPLMIAFLYLLARRDLKAIGKIKLPAGLLIILAVASPWFILEGRAFGAEFFFRQNFERFFHAFDHIQPWYYYFVKLPIHFLPWTLLLPAAVAYWFRRRKEKNPGRTFLLIWFIATFVFFSLSQSKRSLYIVPLYPALSLLVAEALERISSEQNLASLLPWIRGGAAFFALLLVTAGGTAAWLAATRFHDLARPVALLVAAALAGAALLYRMIRKGEGRGIVTAFLVCAFGLELLMAGVVYPSIDVKSRSS
ncbi:MAG: glycosyltransferase family 39 protein, partial [Deltaproteobacteria bacterium]|nr:glycosyltransferase family 39 protein [Deltaproteobacteria bacterium]